LENGYIEEAQDAVHGNHRNHRRNKCDTLRGRYEKTDAVERRKREKHPGGPTKANALCSEQDQYKQDWPKHNFCDQGDHERRLPMLKTSLLTQAKAVRTQCRTIASGFRCSLLIVRGA
jgi:hypothetical protein